MRAQTALPLHSEAHIGAEAKLLDQCRELESKLYGKRLELAMHNGLRDNAQYWLAAMEKVIKERREAALEISGQRGECFFVAAGRYDGQQIQEALNA
jgi:hypothetical protein